MSALAHFEIYERPGRPGGHEEWRWRLRAGNGEIVASGEGYPDELGVRQGIIDFTQAAAVASERQVEVVIE